MLIFLSPMHEDLLTEHSILKGTSVETNHSETPLYQPLQMKITL